MLTEAHINKLISYRRRAEVYNQMLRGLVEFTTKLVGDEDIAHNYIYELWDLDRLFEEVESATAEKEG